MSKSTEKAAGGTLEIRTRHIHAGDGAEAVQRTVYCPRRKSIPLEVCAACPDCLQVKLDPTERYSFVECAPAPGDGIDPGAPLARERGPASFDAGVAVKAGHTPVSAIMNTHVMCVTPAMSVRALLMLLIEHGISGVPVVDEDGRPIGMVSKTDLLWDEYEQMEAEDEWLARKDRDGGERPLLAASRGPYARAAVADIMSSRSLCIHEKAPISEAAALMAYEHVHRLPVVADDGTVVGMVAPLDVMRWLAQKDGYGIPPIHRVRRR